MRVEKLKLKVVYGIMQVGVTIATTNYFNGKMLR